MTLQSQPNETSPREISPVKGDTISFVATQLASLSVLMTLPLAAAKSMTRTRRSQALRSLVACCLFVSSCLSAHAQLSLIASVDLALRNNPKVLMAQADVDKARAQLSETRDVYIPALIGGMGLAYSYGAPLGQPTLFSVTSQSLLYNGSQRDYIRAARAGLEAANLALKDAHQQVIEDVTVTYLALDHSQQRKKAMDQEYGFSNQLVSIVRDRIDAGQDTQVELLRSRRTSAQIRLQQIQLDDEIASYADHLAHLTGLPTANLSTQSDSIPPLPSVTSIADTTWESPGVQAAFANVEVKRLQNAGDKHYAFFPQLTFIAQYSRFSNFNNYSTYYPAFNNNTLNAAIIGAQLQVPLYDRVHRDKVRESSADLFRTSQNAKDVRIQFVEGRLKLQHAATELAARADLAAIDRDLAQSQLDALLIQVQSGMSAGGTPMTPKDEQNARIQERQRFLELLNADLQLTQTEINLLRQTGQLEDWLKSAARVQVSLPPASPQ